MKKLIIVLALGISMLVSEGVTSDRKSVMLDNVAKSAMQHCSRSGGKVPDEVLNTLSQIMALTRTWLEGMDMAGWTETQADLAITAYWLGAEAGFVKALELTSANQKSAAQTVVSLGFALLGLVLAVYNLWDWWKTRKARKATPPKLP